MELVDSEVLTGKPVKIDGKHFHNCRYTQCTLVFEGGEWAATNTKFEQCQLSLDGAAARTMAFMAHIGAARPIAMMPPPQPAPAAPPRGPVH